MSSVVPAESSSPFEPAPRVPEGAYARLMFRGPDGRTVEKNVLRYTTLIGSGPRCNVQLLDPEIAEAHCIVTVESGVLRIRDLRSIAGTHVNGESIQVANLSEGDTIEIGRFSFLVATNLQGAPEIPDIPTETDSDAPPFAELAFYGPDGTPLTKNILRPATLFGSAAGCNMQLVAGAISHAHCVLTMEHGSLRVRDLRSVTGTKVNGVSVEVAALTDGDKLEIGSFAFLVKTNIIPRSLPAGLPPQSPPIDETAAAREELAAAQAELADAQAKLAAANEEFERQHQDLQQRHTDFETKQAEVETAQQALERERQSLKVDREELESQLRAAADSAARFEQEQAELQAEQLRLADRQQEWDVKIEAHVAQVQQWETVRATLESDRTQLDQQDAQLAAARGELEDREQQLTAQQSAMDARQTELDEQRHALDRLREELDRRDTESRSAFERLAQQQETFASDRAKFTAEQQDLDAAKQRHQEEVAHFETEWMRVEEQKDRDQANGEMLRMRFDELEAKRGKLQVEQEALNAARSEFENAKAAARQTQDDEQLQLREVRTQIELRETEVSRREQSIENQKSAHERSAAALRENQENLDAAILAFAQQQTDLDQFRRQHDDDAQALAEQKQQYAADEDKLRQESEKLREQQMALKEQQTSLAHHATEMERSSEDLESHRQQLLADQQRLRDEQENLARETEAIRAERAEFEAVQSAAQTALLKTEEQNRDAARQLQVERDRLADDDRELANQRAELELSAQQYEARRQELNQLQAEIETKQESAKHYAESLEQTLAAHESTVQAFVARSAEHESAQRTMQEERSQLETAQLEFLEALAVMKTDQAELQQQRDAAVRAEEVITGERETLQQVRAALDVELEALGELQEQHSRQASRLDEESAALQAAQQHLCEELAQLAEQRAGQTDRQHELEQMAGKLDLRKSVLDEEERELAEARAAFEADVAAYQRGAAELAAAKEDFAQQQLDATASLIDDFHNVSAEMDAFQVGRDDFQLQLANTPANGNGDGRPLETGNVTSVAALSAASLAGGGIGRTQIDWLLDGRRYRGFFIGHFRILELLGTGSTGWLYEAEDTRNGRTVVLKVLSAQHLANDGMRARFELESRASLEVNHPNIIRALESGSADDARYLVMQVAYGATLQELIELSGPIPCRQACDMIAQAARGLQHIHEKGIIHRDIKPANLLLMHDGELKIIDFGLALIRGDADELTLKVDYGHDCMGTPDYIPPEQARDSFSVDATADIYSLGCTLYFALTGEVPFPHNAVSDKLKAHREHAPQQVSELVSDVPREVSVIVSTMMAKDCNERYQTAAEVAQALKPFSQRAPVYFDFHKILAGRAATAKKRMFLLANHDISRPVTNTNVKRKPAKADQSSPTIQPELAGS